MRLNGRLARGLAAYVVFLSTGGCTEMYVLFGPGGIWGPQSGVGTVTTSQPGAISSPFYVSQQFDPQLEATAGAKVVIAAQLNDDNGDGVIDDNDAIDLVSASDESQPVQIHLNDGQGASFTTITVSGGSPIAIMIDLAVADFDLDGRNDIAVLVNDTGVVPEENGSLRGALVLLFAPADVTDPYAWTERNLDLRVGPDVRALPSDETGMVAFAVADMDGDGDADIVLASNEERSDENIDDDKYIRLYENPEPAVSARDRTAWASLNGRDGIASDVASIKDLKLADLDGDGDLDVVASYPSAKSHQTRWYENPSWIGRMVGQQGEVGPANPGGDAIAVGDIDGDGDPDVAVAHAGLRLVQWFRNPAEPAVPGGWTNVTRQTFPWEVFNMRQLAAGFTIDQLQLVHLDDNGELDCFVSASGAMVGAQRGSNIEDYWLGYTIVATDPPARIGRCAITDINRDGLIDIVAPFDREGLTQDQLMTFTRVTP